MTQHRQCPKCLRLLEPDVHACPRCFPDQPASRASFAAVAARTGRSLTALTQPTPLTGSMLGGRYQILDLLGTGGMGTVCRAQDIRSWSQVAVKLLDPALVAHPTARERMEREAAALARLRHPNVVQLLDRFDHAGQPVLVLEYVVGGALSRWIGQAGAPSEVVLPWLSGILAGLQAIHDAGLVHRDIKPDNVLLTEHGQPKLADLGVARDTTAAKGPAITRLGTQIGTAAYMSPEQVQGQVVDARSDIFAVGLLAYELITGRKAFARDTDVECMAAIVRDPVDLAALRGRCAPGLAHAIAQALAKDPADRFASARALGRAIQTP